MEGYRLTSKLREFVLAGNATFTIVSTRKDSRLTYKVQKHNHDPIWFVKVRSGHSFEYLGTIRDNKYSYGKKSSFDIEAPETIGFAWLWIHLDELPEFIEFWHEGHCGRCGRQLTVPESIYTGIGPECAKAMGISQIKLEHKEQEL